MSALSIKNFTRQPLPRLPYERARELTLPGWEISLVFVGETRAKHLNETLRKKSYVPNVLSYQVGVKSGEIIICLSVAKRQASSYGLLPTAYCLLLLIHGLLHLKGCSHSATMERRERALVARLAAIPSFAPFPLYHEATHSHRHRHRHVPGQAGRGRRAR